MSFGSVARVEAFHGVVVVSAHLRRRAAALGTMGASPSSLSREDWTRLAKESEGMPNDSSRDALTGAQWHSGGQWCCTPALQSRLHCAVFMCTVVLMHTAPDSGTIALGANPLAAVTKAAKHAGASMGTGCVRPPRMPFAVSFAWEPPA